MDRLRQTLSYIGAQLSVLTVSQRVAIGLCAALIAGSLLWLMQWSITPEMASISSHDFDLGELTSAEDALTEKGIPFSTRGARILVRPTDRYRAMRVLYDAGALPEGSLFTMDSVVKDTNVFKSPAARETARIYATGNELAKIIATYPFVKDARVMINPKTKRRLDRTVDEPTASVSVTLVPAKEMTPQLVEGFAKLVSGAVAGLKPHNVNVIDKRTGRSYNTRHPDEFSPSDYLDQVKEHETYLAEKIMAKLADIPGVLVAVSVELDNTKRVTQTNTYSEPVEKTQTSSETTQTSASQPTEPGVQPNTGVAVTAGATGQSGSTEDSSTDFFPPNLTETETIERPPFARKSVTATVSIPRSFLVGIFKAASTDRPDPTDDDPQFVTIRDEQVARVKKSVEQIVMAQSPDDVEVDVYPDMQWGPAGGEWSPVPGYIGGARDGFAEPVATDLVREYGPQVGMGFLGLVSLLLMTRIVRKSSQLAAIQAKKREIEEVQEDDLLMTVGPYPIGEAEVSEGMLTGKEVDEETLRYQELGQEVSRMVTADPSGAADLIRRWVEDID